MNTILKRTKSFITAANSNQYWIFILAVYATIEIIKTVWDTIEGTANKITTMWDLPIFQWHFVENIIQVLTVIVLYRIFRRYNRAKAEMEHLVQQINAINENTYKDMTSGFSQLTNNINDLHRILDLKIRYVDFSTSNTNIDDGTFILKLHAAGFSKEDLVEIGVNEEFIKKNSSRLLPRAVIDKFKAFKAELNHHKDTTKE